ncbi:MAG: MBOAT family protein [Elusimicrobia bacterium]|nr:MBOAT family protein [Elusimicrobiota bacterium]
MVFSSLVFLFVFLPLALAAYFLAPRKSARNLVLVLMSLLFYAWGEGGFVFFLLALVGANYAIALAMRRLPKSRGRKAIFIAGITLNVVVLLLFKYSAFFVANMNVLLAKLSVRAIHYNAHRLRFRLGISFFTFHELSYLIDVYRGTAPAETNPIDSVLYILLFPQLIAGPIVRYHQIAAQIKERTVGSEDFVAGIRRFIVGLGKKCLIGNNLGRPVDLIFAYSPDLTRAMAWYGALLYGLQIYFDFSGYSDMAIGLARMFGFRFPENFNYPYVSRSITEFWARWHISLSTWFRDYLYIPLLVRTRYTLLKDCLCIVLVFLLCGFWHGASWSFVAWGLYYGVFLAIERAGLSRLLNRIGPLAHLYALAVIMAGWVLFRAKDLAAARIYLRLMFGHNTLTAMNPYVLHYCANSEVLAIVAVGLLACLPIIPWIREHEKTIGPALPRPLVFGWQSASFVALAAIAVFSVASLASGTYNPFIYFQF